MIQLSMPVFMKSRQGTKGAYESGFVTISDLDGMLSAAKSAGLNALGFGGIRELKTPKFTGKIIKLTPFTLSPKK